MHKVDDREYEVRGTSSSLVESFKLGGLCQGFEEKTKETERIH